MRGLVQIVFGLIVGGIGAAWAGPLWATVSGPAEELLGAYARPAPVGLQIAGGLYVVTGLVTMVASGLSGMMASGRDAKDEQRQLDIFHELLTGATVRMVGIDGVIAPAEMSMVSGVLEKFGQTPVADKTIRSIAEASAKDPERYLNMMRDRAGDITDEQKTHILRACLLVAMADVVLDPAEVEYLNKVAEALNVPAERLDAIKRDLTAVTAKLIGAAAFAA